MSKKLAPLLGSLNILNSKIVKKYPYNFWKDWQKVKCIYLLVKNDIIVYVGKSHNLIARIGIHTQDKDFDNVYYIQLNDFDNQELLDLKKSLMRVLQPKYNKDSATKTPFNLYDSKNIQNVFGYITFKSKLGLNGINCLG